MPRCPNGTRKNIKTGNCEVKLDKKGTRKNKVIDNEKLKIFQIKIKIKK
jgi:hypothetical protein